MYCLGPFQRPLDDSFAKEMNAAYAVVSTDPSDSITVQDDGNDVYTLTFISSHGMLRPCIL